MDGLHDLGGREGFGAIVGKEDAEPFHAQWEMRAFGVTQSSAGGKGWSIDWFRYCRELADPVDYLTRPYFDQWITALTARMADEGYLTLEEIKAGASAFIPKPAVPPLTPEASRAFVADPRKFVREPGSPPRFAPGDVVRCKLDGHPGHTRMPAYVRGREGVIHAHHGGHILPDASARGEERGEHLYTVSFAALSLWPEAKAGGDRVMVDLWRAILARPDPGWGYLKARDGEPVFGEPWHAEALAVADLLVKSGMISASRWAETLGAEIKASHSAPDDSDTFFHAVLSALERLLAEHGSVSRAELDARQQQWERAYLSTPHGLPVELSAGEAPD